MNRFLLYTLPVVLLLIVLCCSQEKTQHDKTLARINDYRLFLDEFEYLLAKECELNEDYKLTSNAKREFLEELIKKELLLQEAKRLRLDRKAEFVRAIERYWEATLIRNLIDLKSREFSERSHVSEDAVEARYKELLQSDKTLAPMDAMRERIVEELKDQKETRMLEQWVNELRKNARIEIDEDLLAKGD